jgi:hypothetical protein
VIPTLSRTQDESLDREKIWLQRHLSHTTHPTSQPPTPNQEESDNREDLPFPDPAEPYPPLNLLVSVISEWLLILEETVIPTLSR